MTLVARTPRGSATAWRLGRRAATRGSLLPAAARLSPAGVDRVFLTGGTSFVPAVRRLFEDRFGAGKISTGAELESIAAGLSLIAAEPDPLAWCERAA